ncbi:unnamed protein product [Ilex paraguariensis]|uniref:DELLA protein n=1 Tax=Ilex paraguariensis TaxID=185542 RepID=A0ABC8S6Q0_9AQUA
MSYNCLALCRVSENIKHFQHHKYDIPSVWVFELMSDLFTMEQFDFGGASDEHSSFKEFDCEVGGYIAKQTQLCGIEDWLVSIDTNLSYSGLGLYEDNTIADEMLLSKYQREQLQLFSHFRCLDDLCFDIVSPLFPSCDDKISNPVSIHPENVQFMEPMKDKAVISPLASLKIINNYESRFRRLSGKQINMQTYDTNVSSQKLSTGKISRLAREKFIQSCSQRVDELSSLSHLYPSSFLGLAIEEAKDVGLVHCLLASAEKVGQRQFDRASKLLNHCDGLSSNKGNAVQRLAFYFSKALREKINRETGRVTSRGLEKKQSLDLEEAMMIPNIAIVSFCQKLPSSQVVQFTLVQIIVDNVAEAKKVHIIDLDHQGWNAMYGFDATLAARRKYPLEHLKVTAIGTRFKTKLEETGERLMSFARSINLPFSFHVVMVTDMLDLNEDVFELDTEETLAVNSSYSLRSLIAWTDLLECLMRVMRKIHPCVMVVSEIEANHNSPVFVALFIEALLSYGAFFDSLQDCMSHDESNRIIIESMYFSQAIQNIVAAEGEERTI